MSDINTLITGLLPDLHSDSITNLTWWTKAELIQWADEALKRAAKRFALFINRDASQTTSAAGGSFARASRHLATLHVNIGNRSLTASSSEELFAADESYQTTQGDPEERWFEDKLATTTGYQPLTPAAAAGRTIRALYTEFPAELDTGELNTTIPGPLCFGDYIQTAIRAEANSKESDAAMPEVAKHDRELMSLYESLFSYYWGENQ
jgi:hypothetical protein